MTPAARPNSILNRHLSTYALAGGSLLALCPTVSAAPVRYDKAIDIFIPITSMTGTGLSLPIDMNGDGNFDFAAFALAAYDQSCYYTELRNGRSGSAIVAKPVTGESFNAAVAFNYGDMIGPSSQPWSEGSTGILLRRKSFSEQGDWPNDINQTRYEGVRFQIHGKNHYGWIAASTSYYYPELKLQVSGWGYETEPDTAIAAGDGEPVPEPSSLALFASGAAGIAAVLRRRRARG